MVSIEYWRVTDRRRSGRSIYCASKETRCQNCTTLILGYIAVDNNSRQNEFDLRRNSLVKIHKSNITGCRQMAMSTKPNNLHTAINKSFTCTQHTLQIPQSSTRLRYYAQR